MGDHYLPQYYLKGFSQRSGREIWAYDKQEGRKFPTQVKSIASETRFYSPECEQYLANSIEGPANPVLKKIRNRGQVTDDDKKILADYMVVMMKRVPQGKKRVKEVAPTAGEKLCQLITQVFSIQACIHPERADFFRRLKADSDEILDRLAQEPPKEVWLNTIAPEKTPGVVDAIRGMTWRFFTVDEKPAFLTCDNPVFYFTSKGIGRLESEITFPICSHVTLWATWRPELSEGYFSATSQLVKEINRRTVRNATRYVYHCADEHWVLPFVTKGGWQLHRLLLLA